ncbi:MAG: S41 family peptidase [Lentimicrobiaceae bacterium]|jgi:carboxyl-terminal processing protease
MKNRIIPALKAIMIISVFLTFTPTSTLKAQTSPDFEISKNLEILTSLYKELNVNYVDGINPSDLMKTGIDAMLDKLDPYTVFIPESEIEDFRFMTTGEYGGIGSLIHKQGNYVIISEPYENSPAQKSGLKAGDKILKINDKDASGKSVEDVSAILKGQPGTNFKIEVERPGEPKPLIFNIVREKITIDPVPYYGMLDGGLGYIRLTSFTQTASDEVKKALLDLKEKNVVTGLVLDLRDNGGGLLSEAVNIVNLFVKKNELVVSTKGKQADKNRNYKTTMDPVDTNIPLVVLVNGNSASASEIVAGSLQDLDRAVIVGRRTYGKGLVQNVFPLSYNTEVKITVAKYYIPSGRCIQEIDYAHRNAAGNTGNVPDSLITAYKTMHGRTVYDGKGIAPDVTTDTMRLSTVSYNLITKYILFDYATRFAAAHATIEPARTFKLSDADYNDFIAFTEKNGFEFKTAAERDLETVKKAAIYEKCWNDIKSQYDAMQETIVQHKKQDLVENKPEIEDFLQQEIASRYYYQKGRIESTLRDDTELKSAINVLKDSATYTSILDGTLIKADKQSKPLKTQN